MRLDQMIAKMAARLSNDGIDTAKLDARLLARHALGLSDVGLLSGFDRILDDRDIACLEVLMQRRLKREPVAHILGERDFWGLLFKVTKDTLVPRPDSETLVAGILDTINDHDASLTILDIGTGSGCLLLSLLSELPNAVGVGADISSPALAVAQQNAEALDLAGRACFVRGHYAEAFSGGIDILISNPPYLAAHEMDDLEVDVAQYDPAGALVSGESGLEAYQQIFSSVHEWDRIPGLMAFEFGHAQAQDVQELAKMTGLVARAGSSGKILKDLGGRNRVYLLQSMQY
ncbi:peptide chain release factor N(5)-glutamine methyltransferase [uncultured Cohaesibacter sp.]|uniref:peptide chain release factor N(5)-glutamine methyltransferase n=1 Tax=uncultured Cohaesibacter sp. TaxID=1002546 RepID=UPI00292D823B|nr:peptide chain release factor N(5)-glutamine methyltransferase [uncultured Cohaesibacter sp.]